MADPQHLVADYDVEAEPTQVAPLSDQEMVRAIAEYMADMIGQLENMAKSARLDLLVYLLSMAKAEAQASAHPGPPRPAS